jgi:phosphate transport system substrate-binding protein
MESSKGIRIMSMAFKTSAVALSVTGMVMCGSAGQDPARLSGSISIDGSSTVYPITQAVSEEFSDVAPNVRVTVGISGTGGGFKRFALGETDISDASRPIKKEEMDAAKQAGIEFIELPVAYDGLSIVVHPSNDWVDYLTVDEIKSIFLAEKAAKNWSDVRQGWPNQRIKLFAPGTDSGTFDYFKEVMGGDIRADMSVSEDDNVLVTGVAGDANSLGFFGYAYYVENEDKLKVVPVVNPKLGTPVEPSHDTIESGEYAPFSRPLFIYVNKKSSTRPEVREFVEFYLDEAADLVDEVGYVALPEDIYEAAMENFGTGRTGTKFITADGKKAEGSLRDIYLK